MIPRQIRVFIQYALIITLSISTGFLVFEAYVRSGLIKKIPERVWSAPMWIQTNSLHPSPADKFFGRTAKIPTRGGLFKENIQIDIAVAHPTAGVLNFSTRTNNVGLLSDHDYAIDRKPDESEFRILMIGDSMTGTTTATYQWVDTVEELLNSNEEFKAKVGRRNIRVYNLGWVGAGFQTFWTAFQLAGRHYDADLVVVNYIDIDFPRSDAGHIVEESKIIEHAVKHVKSLTAAHPRVLFSLMPIYEEYISGKLSLSRTQALKESIPGLDVEVMYNRMPTALGKDEMESWYSIPFDSHMSDRGGEFYARAMSEFIIEKVSNLKVNFMGAKTKHGDLRTGAPRVRKVTTSLSHISENKATLNKLKTEIVRRELIGKVWSLFPYSYHLPVNKTDGLSIPYARTKYGGFEKIKYDVGQDDVVFLFLACTTEDNVSLANPECYHFQHIFVK